MPRRYLSASAAACFSLLCSVASAGEIRGFNFPVPTYSNKGELEDFVITENTFSGNYDGLFVVAAMPRLKLVQISNGEEYFNVDVRKVIWANPEKYADLGNGLKICVGGSTRSGAAGGALSPKGGRGLGVEPLC